MSEGHIQSEVQKCLADKLYYYNTYLRRHDEPEVILEEGKQYVFFLMRARRLKEEFYIKRDILNKIRNDERESNSN